MKKIVIGSILTLSFIGAEPIKLTKKQESDWQIEHVHPRLSSRLMLGRFMAEVKTPPQYFYSVTLPFEAQVKKLYVAKYDGIKKGQPLAEVTGRDWIEIQQRFIADAIELKHHGHIAKRKNRLCKEGIIPKKECASANAEHQADKIKASASKALLRGYGASKKMIKNLFEKLKISKSIELHAPIGGKILELNVQSGKSTNPTDALFVIQEKGALWLEIEIPIKNAMKLKEKEIFHLKFNDEEFSSKLLLKAPVINVKNQTQSIRFLLPNNAKFLTGMRGLAELSVTSNSLRISKKSLITVNEDKVVFVVSKEGYVPMVVDIFGEDDLFYYIEGDVKSSDSIASSSLVILKSIMEGGDDE